MQTLSSCIEGSPPYLIRVGTKWTEAIHAICSGISLEEVKIGALISEKSLLWVKLLHK